MEKNHHKILRQTGLNILRKILPKEEIEKITKEEYPKGRKRALTSALYFGLLVFAQIEKGINSLDELLEAGLGKVSEVYQMKGAGVKKQSFSERSQILPWQILKRIFEYLVKVAKESGVELEKLYQGAYTIKVLDSTILDVVARLIGVVASHPTRRIKLRRSKKKKGQIKLKAIFNKTLGLPELINIDKALSSELKKVKKLVRKAIKKASGVILVFDLGYFCYEFLSWLIGEKVWFVSRIKENTRYEVIKKLARNEWLIKLGITAPGQKEVLVRLVRVREKGEWYYYITNLMDRRRIKVKQIREIYRYRWAIEIFFREMKEVLNIKKIFFYNPNGVKSQIYVALSVYVISKILIAESARKHNVSEVDFSFQRTIQIIRIWFHHHPEKVFGIKPRRAMIEALLEKICEFACRKRCPKDAVKDKNHSVRREKDVA